jgi:hypothetical protein
MMNNEWQKTAVTHMTKERKFYSCFATNFDKAFYAQILKKEVDQWLADGYEIVADPQLPIKPFVLLDPTKRCVWVMKVIKRRR